MVLRILIVLIIIISACGYPKPENNLQPVDNNGLSSVEKAMGWEPLFDGTSMDLWRVYQEEGLRGWTVQDGEMVALGVETKPADIVTKSNFTNFELRLEWNIGENGNSGIFFNVNEDPAYGAVYHTGPEYQLIDDIGYADKIMAAQKSGANYDISPPRVEVSKPAGKWNASRLIVDNGHVQHWLNGKKVVAYDLWTEEWEKAKNNAKWKDYPKYGTFKSGHIALQDHGGQIRFRNIKVRRLD